MNNTDQEEFWSKSAGPAWVTLQSELDNLMQPVLDLVLTHANLQTGQRVLDIGCGTGASVAQAADIVGDTGHVTGLDIADTMLNLAKARLSSHPNTNLMLTDAQTEPFERNRFDALISRFGVMFFEDSAAAFANMSTALAPDSALTFAAWGPARQNPFFMEPARAATELLGEMPKVDRTQPGPFAFEDTNRVTAILETAGLVSIQATTTDLHLTPAGDLRDVGDLCCSIGPADSALRYHEGSSEDRKALSEAIALRFARFETPDGVRIPAAINLFQARTAA
ncbi:MAG: methyltransferase domain-containing protein [Tateyamaria sp.]|uniref:class I SAM-dependent methyltransferase n=1 Tax=Tateyamaria sp. TaxID=1929288 RepID=UPI00329FB0C9